MRNNLQKSINYGLLAFLVAACYFGMVTSPDWHLVSNGNGEGQVYIHIHAILEAMCAGVAVMAIVALGFNKTPFTMNAIHLIAKLFAQSVFCGIACFVCWVGIGMFSLMGAPDTIINRAYYGGVLLSMFVAVIAFPLICWCWFWKRHGRLVPPDDLMSF